MFVGKGSFLTSRACCIPSVRRSSSPEGEFEQALWTLSGYPWPAKMRLKGSEVKIAKVKKKKKRSRYVLREPRPFYIILSTFCSMFTCRIQSNAVKAYRLFSTSALRRVMSSSSSITVSFFLYHRENRAAKVFKLRFTFYSLPPCAASRRGSRSGKEYLASLLCL